MARFFKSLAVLLLLVAAQQGSVVHDLSHLASVSTHGHNVDADLTDGAPCALCPVFAQASAPIFSHSFQPPDLHGPATERTSAPLRELIDSPAPRPRSRGPPV